MSETVKPLGDLLAEAISRAAPLERLAALASLDADAAARWVLTAPVESLPEGDLKGLLSELSRAESGRLGEDLAERLVRRLPDVMSPDAAVAFAERVSPDRILPLRPVIERILERAPGHPPLLRFAAQLAARAGDAHTAHRLLTRLGRNDEGPATMQLIRRTRKTLPSPDAPSVRVALVSSFTVDPLVPYVDFECRALGLAPDIYVAPFNSWTSDMLRPDSGLRRFEPEMVFLSVALDDLAPELAGAPDQNAVAAAGRSAVGRVLEAARGLRTWSEALLVVHGFHTVHRDPAWVIAGRGLPRSRWVAELNAALAAGLGDLPGAYLLDTSDMLARRAGGAADNPKMRHLASMRLGEGALPEIARAYAAHIAPLKGLTRKCVVLDLDNTLWGGIVGEDGPTGIKLGVTAPGSEYREFQSYLATLRDRGILLAIASKNNSDDALAVIRGHDEMILREDAFAAMRINWQPKPENLAAIAEELNIGLDSLVFVDDNPDERELVRQLLPQVLVVDLPRDPALYRRTLEVLPQLQTLVVTDEDRRRAVMYDSRRDREQLKVSAQSLEDFLHSLELVVDVAPASEATLPRVQQLIQRTNQFNLTTRRYEAAELTAMSRDADWRIYTARARDKFGDHGLVATALAHAEGSRWRIDSFLMSCRVIGYGVETALLAALSEDARAAGASTLVGEFVPTKKNAPAKDFYALHGFASDGATAWVRSLAEGPIDSARWIRSTADTGA